MNTARKNDNNEIINQLMSELTEQERHILWYALEQMINDRKEALS